MKPRTDAPLKLVRNVCRLNRELSDIEHLNYYDVEVREATVKAGKEKP